MASKLGLSGHMGIIWARVPTLAEPVALEASSLWSLMHEGGPFGQVAIKSGLRVSPEPLAIGKLPWSKRQNHGEARCSGHRHGSAKNAGAIEDGGLSWGWGLLAFAQARSDVGRCALTD